MGPLVAFDEAGNSGGNLLDIEQPVFVLASVYLPEDYALQLTGIRNREYKFATLRRTSIGRRTILTILDSPLLTDDRYLISGFHKPFMAISKIVDLLLEPLAHRSGFDLYDRGANIALSNMLYFCLPKFLGRDVYDKIIEYFIEMVRNPTQGTVQNFYAFLEKVYRMHRDKNFASQIAMLLASRVIAEDYIDDWDGSDLDPAIPAFVEHASVWTSRLQTSFQIVHDLSKPIINEQLLLEAMMSETEQRVNIGYDRRKMTFPIAARGIEFLDSAKSLQIQIADILASGAAYCLRASVRGVSDDFVNDLLKTRVLSGTFRPVWPELKVSPGEMGTTEAGGGDVIGEIGAYVSKRLGGIPPKGMRRKK